MQDKGNAIHGVTTFPMVMQEHLDSVKTNNIK